MDAAMKPDLNEAYFEPCIDLDEAQPIGDMIVTYLLALRNDIDTKDRIETLESAVELRLELESTLNRVPNATEWGEAARDKMGWGQESFFCDAPEP